MTARDLLFFLLGAGFGGGLAYLVMSREEEEEIPIEEPVRNVQNDRKEEHEEQEEEYIVDAVVRERMTPPKKTTITSETSTLDDYKSKQHVPTKEYFKIAGDYTAYVEDENGLNQVEKDFLENMTREPEKITPDVWRAGLEGPYEHVVLIYYPESGMLKREIDDTEVDIPYLLVGNAIEDSLFQFSEDNFMYVRNYRNQVDYEIRKFNPRMVK